MNRHQTSTTPIRLAILDMYDGVPNQGMRCIQEIVSRYDSQLSWEVFDVRDKAETPDMSFDIYISTGGPGSPYDGDGHWDVRYYEWLDAVWKWNQKDGEDKKHVFFICHSFQMACKYFQVAEISIRKSQSFGTFPCRMTTDGFEDPGFKGLSSPFWVADFRHWQVVEPKMKRLDSMGARILALEKIRPHIPLERAIMAIRFSREIFGTQFHPEADPKGMLDHFLDPQRRKSVIEEHSEEKYSRMIRDLNDPSKLQLTQDIVIPLFLNHSIQKITQRKKVSI